MYINWDNDEDENSCNTKILQNKIRRRSYICKMCRLNLLQQKISTVIKTIET